MRTNRVPLRHSLLTRLLVTSILIAVAATTATAWLAVRTATRAISQEQGRSLADDKGVYDMLIGYAATHPDWSGAPELIEARAVELGRRITLMTEDRQVIADSAAGPPLRTARPSAVVDPLNLDLGLTGGGERIDSRAVGPLEVPPSERPDLQQLAAKEVDCLRGLGLDATVGTAPNGRPVVTRATPDLSTEARWCDVDMNTLVTKTEQKALRSLADLAGRCLDLPDPRTLWVRPDFSVYQVGASIKQVPGEQPLMPAVPLESASVSATDVARVQSCVEKSRRALLQPYVAPPALLFVTDPGDGADQTTFTLSTENTVRIVAVTGAVLLATIVVTVLVGRRLVRPLRALTEAVDQHAPAPIAGADEIGRLARALNDSVERRDRAETQRRDMVTDVAHELRTPLSNIRSWLEAAQDNLTPTDAQLLELLHEEAVLLQHIIDDLSDLAAADAGTLRIHPEPTYLRDVLTQVVDAHLGTAHAAGVRLIMDIRDDPVLPADAVRLRQLVGNLVSNAIRHTPAGGTVTVGAHDTTITVRDTGVGIAAENLPRVFDRFWRAEASRSRATGGSGLGLAIARKLAEAHGGTIGVASEPGRGALFTVRLASSGSG
ncbi:HAMP domain-containing sensor histidine kinase [Micromonospora sp. WMMA1363]|uniref:sensor histidine kinase n=1 Tax=Micromonospora sp. WMMA1363 TaxID=3053985 RepID=UPI00259C9D59|nr:HAMP domain-containing sensor histidine kinase [Micromonospora sp. WMMA1363]MDM4722842.1 HAMP domain-containing sensor histidine kinase [Micromonospora sp. WMMA1363]